jgi:hypothetical protein
MSLAMKKQMFEEACGKPGNPARTAEAFAADRDPSFRRPRDSRTNQPFAIGIRTANWRKREDPSKLGTRAPPPDGSGSGAIEYH